MIQGSFRPGRILTAVLPARASGARGTRLGPHARDFLRGEPSSFEEGYLRSPQRRGAHISTDSTSGAELEDTFYRVQFEVHLVICVADFLESANLDIPLPGSFI